MLQEQNISCQYGNSVNSINCIELELCKDVTFPFKSTSTFSASLVSLCSFMSLIKIEYFPIVSRTALCFGVIYMKKSSASEYSQ